jgi:hypothetical protein
MSDGQAELQQQINKLVAQLGDISNLDTRKILLAFAEKFLAEANQKGVVPFKTGHLASTGNVKADDNGAEVRYDADYAYYVEFGSTKWQGHPWLRPTIDTKADLILQSAKNELQKQIDSKTKGG